MTVLTSACPRKNLGQERQQLHSSAAGITQLRAAATAHNRAAFICAFALESPMFAFAMGPVRC